MWITDLLVTIYMHTTHMNKNSNEMLYIITAHSGKLHAKIILKISSYHCRDGNTGNKRKAHYCY